MLSWSIPCSPGQFFPPREGPDTTVTRKNCILKGRNLERIAAFRWGVGGHPPEPEKGRRVGSTEARILKNESKLWQSSGYCNCNKQGCCDIISRIVPTGWHRFLQVYTSFYGPSRQKGPREKQQSSRRVNTELVLNGKKNILYYCLFFSSGKK